MPPVPRAPREPAGAGSSGAAEATIRERAEKRVGGVLDGKYTLERVLGVGGMAAVYRAVHRNGNRVAVKMLHREISLDADLRARFVREGYVANAIPHPGAVHVLDDDVSEDGAAFLVMELLEGETLLQRAAREGGRLPEIEVAAIAHRLLDVLVAAHGAGVVHRDVKPENVFLTTDGVVKVLDFGVARMRDPGGSGPTHTGRVMGTPAFMPPEQALGRGKDIDERSDVWACGATMFTLLTGRYVHDAETPEELVVKTATTPVVPLRDVMPAASKALAAVVDRALAFKKGDRYPSAREMQLALDAAATSSFGAVPEPPHGVDGETRASIGRAPTVEASAPELEALRAPSPGSLPGFDSGSARLATTGKSARPPPPRRRRTWIAAGAIGVVVAFAAWRAGMAPSAPLVSPRIESDAGAPVVACATSAECVQRAGGVPSVCRRERGCVALKSAECGELLAEPGDVGNDRTIWVGAMIPRHGPDGAPFGQSTVNFLDLARRDFASMSNGVPGARPGDPDRPIAIVLCDDSAGSAAIVQHLVDDVGVPAVIGFGKSKDLLALAPSTFNPRGVLALAALNTSPLLATIPRSAEGHRLVWRVTNSADGTAGAIAAFLEATAPPAGVGDPMRVALLRRANPAQVAFADRFLSTLRVGGRTVAGGGADLRQYLFDEDHPEQDDARRAGELLAFAPHVVVSILGPHIFGEGFVGRIERDWPAGRGERPRYILSGAGMIDEAIPLVGKHPDLRRRIFAADTPPSIPANVKLAIHYSEVFSPRVTPANTFGPPYDAFYLLAYAIVALGERPVTGTNLAGAIERLLPPGPPIDVGPASIPEAFQLLRSGKNIDLNGSTTTLDYDLKTGDPPATLAIYCLRTGPDRRSFESGESGLVFDPRSGKLTGTLACP